MMNQLFFRYKQIKRKKSIERDLRRALLAYKLSIASLPINDLDAFVSQAKEAEQQLNERVNSLPRIWR